MHAPASSQAVPIQAGQHPSLRVRADAAGAVATAATAAKPGRAAGELVRGVVDLRTTAAPSASGPEQRATQVHPSELITKSSAARSIRLRSR
jgi:hypothetical protein